VPQITLFSHTTFGIFLYGLTVLVGLGLLIFEASLSHSGMDYTWLLYTLVDSEFTSSLNSLETKSAQVKLEVCSTLLAT